MQLTCPCCSARFPVEAALMDEAARIAVAAALKLPAPLADHLLRYIAMFRPSQRALSWDRAARLLSEVLGMVEAGHIERHGKRYRTTLECWRQGLEEMLAARQLLRLPLKSHGYLLEVLAGLSPGIEAAAEARLEADRRAGRHRVPEPVQATDPHLARERLQGVLAGLKGGRRDG